MKEMQIEREEEIGNRGKRDFFVRNDKARQERILIFVLTLKSEKVNTCCQYNQCCKQTKIQGRDESRMSVKKKMTCPP